MGGMGVSMGIVVDTDMAVGMGSGVGMGMSVGVQRDGSMGGKLAERGAPGRLGGVGEGV